MSHYSVAVFTEENGKTLEELLAKFDENIEMPEYITYTKEQLIEKSKKEVLEYSTVGFYGEYIKDKEKYIKSTENTAHLNYLENEFPKRLSWTDEEHYQEAIKYENLDENGSAVSKYNPFSKWDWYQIGGRASGKITLKDGTKNLDSALVKNINFQDGLKTFAVVLPTGEWFEKGKMGWWACVSNEDEEWDKNYKERFIETAKYEWTLTIVDCHI